VYGKLDAAFDDIGEQQLKNIAKPIRAYRLGPRNSPIVPERLTPPLPDKPSIAVLPFQSMSGDPEQEYFADGIVEEITTALSRFKTLFVIARNSSFTQSYRCETNWHRVGCPLRAGRERPQGRESSAHHRSINRYDNRHPSVGRPVRWCH
jgi:hypothetical protein